MFWNTRSSSAWCVWQPPASSAWGSCSCCCQRSGTRSRCVSWPISQTRRPRTMEKSSQSLVSTLEAAVEQMVQSLFPWHDIAKLCSQPLLTSFEDPFAHAFTAYPGGEAGCLVHMDSLSGRQEALSFVPVELHLDLHYFTARRGNWGPSLILQTKRVLFIFFKYLPRSVLFLARTQNKSCLSSPDLLCGLYSVNINIGRASLAQSYMYLWYLFKAQSIRVLF